MARSARWRTIVALAGLSVLAIAGQLVLNQAAATVAHNEGKARDIWTFGFDFNPFWLLDRFFTVGHGFALWYGKISNPYPPPHEVIFAPFSYLPREAAQTLTIILSTALMVVALYLWARRSDTGLITIKSGMWPLLLSAPAFAVVVIDQFQTVFTLAMLSLALWAQRRDRWWLVGPAAALGLVRVPNALPVLAMLLVGAWGKPRQFLIALGSGALVMAPPTIMSFIWDPSWPSHYLEGIAYYPSNGLPKLASGQLGYRGLALLALATCLTAAWLVRHDRGRPLDPGRSALGMAIGVVVAPLAGLYAAIFVLPAILQLGFRQTFRWLPWAIAVGPWLAVIALSPFLLGPDPYLVLADLSVIDFVLLAVTYPLLRLPPLDASSDMQAGSPPLPASAA